MDATKESGELHSGQGNRNITNTAVVVAVKQKITKPTVAVNRNFP